MDDERQRGDDVYRGYGPSVDPQPVTPGYDPNVSLATMEDRPLPRNRADFILFLGILSLFVCWPMGIVAWVMGNTDLKKIRQHLLSANRIGVLKTGRFLGMFSTAMFVVSVVLLVLFAPRQLPNITGTFSGAPLPPERVAYVGEWRGDQGTTIIIRSDGTGDFRTGSTTASPLRELPHQFAQILDPPENVLCILPHG